MLTWKFANVASLHRCHRAFRRSYADVEGGFNRQDNGMARATYSCGTLLRQVDGLCFVFASAYGPTVPLAGGELL